MGPQQKIAEQKKKNKNYLLFRFHSSSREKLSPGDSSRHQDQTTEQQRRRVIATQPGRPSAPDTSIRTGPNGWRGRDLPLASRPSRRGNCCLRARGEAASACTPHFFFQQCCIPNVTIYLWLLFFFMVNTAGTSMGCVMEGCESMTPNCPLDGQWRDP